MSKSPLRKDKTCLNCRFVVENRFCPNCGQENIDPRKTFYHLFVHFFEDLTHYENAFWKTIKNLLLKPAALTKEYLSGKRLSYLAPVRLYIFISFVTFFTIAIFPNEDETVVLKVKNSTKDMTAENKQNSTLILPYNTLEELEAHSGKISSFEYRIYKKIILIKKKYTYEEIKEKFIESAVHNFPKILIIYMPLFAFILWLFHGKKRWYYFDHGIFTLHYFSFLLLMFFLEYMFDKMLFSFFAENNVTNFISSIVSFIGLAWMLYYFFPAHRIFYEESKGISTIKSVSMLIINSILTFLILIPYIIYSFIIIH